MILIPKISDERLEELCKRIKPVVRYAKVDLGSGSRLEEDPRGVPYYIKEVHPRNVAFTWDPKPDRPATGLIMLMDIETYHTYGAPIFFKPSIAEVIAQIPADCIDRVVAFETSKNAALDGDNHHVTMTRLYRRK